MHNIVGITDFPSSSLPLPGNPMHGSYFFLASKLLPSPYLIKIRQSSTFYYYSKVILSQSFSIS